MMQVNSNKYSTWKFKYTSFHKWKKRVLLDYTTICGKKSCVFGLRVSIFGQFYEEFKSRTNPKIKKKDLKISNKFYQLAIIS